MPVYAQGATERLLALATPTPKGYWGVPVLVWGRPGTGKSTFIDLTTPGASNPRLPERTKRFLEGAWKVADARKGDSIYTCVRDLIKSGWLQERAAADPSIVSILKRLSQHFEELTQILEAQ